MATTDYGICNLALASLKQTTFIESLTEETSTAKLCNLLYDEARRSLLKSFHWSFSIGRATLALWMAPNWGFANSFALPSDNLHILRTDDLDYIYRIENNLLLTDETAIKVKYIIDKTTVSGFPQHFTEMLVASIALKLIPALIQDEKQNRRLTKDLSSRYAIHLDFAIKGNDIEDFAENVRHTNANEISWDTTRT